MPGTSVHGVYLFFVFILHAAHIAITFASSIQYLFDQQAPSLAELTIGMLVAGRFGSRRVISLNLLLAQQHQQQQTQYLDVCMFVLAGVGSKLASWL